MEISIKKPCHENWSDMAPNEQGAFCGKCVKTVIDFSSKSLDEITAFFAGREQEKVCGRFEEKQLTALSFDAFFKKFRHFEFTKRFAVILFFTFGVWLFGASPASAQSNTHVKGDVQVEERILNGNVKAIPSEKDKINCTKPNPGSEKVVGKIAVVKPIPAKDPVKPTPVKDPVKPKPDKNPVKMGEVTAPAPKNTAPKK